MPDFARYMSTQDKTAHRRAEWECAGARLELAQRDERIALLLSQHEPVATLGLDRERLRLALQFIGHGDLNRLERDRRDLLGIPQK